MPFSTLTATTQAKIPRKHLAEWDASIRAWLRIANRIKEWEQNQLMLILANINISIKKDIKLLSSILKAWKSALILIKKLIEGIA